MPAAKRAFLVLFCTCTWGLASASAHGAEPSAAKPAPPAAPAPLPPQPAPSPPAASPAAQGSPHYARAALELGAGLAAGTLWYWIDDRNVLDWDNPSIQQRLNGEAWRYDNNGLPINFVFHPLSGAGWYMAARANGLSVPLSFAYSAAGSLLWEYAIEFKEKVSINDTIITPGAGFVIGEFLDKLSIYLTEVPSRGPAQSTAQWVLGFPRKLHQSLDGVTPPEPPQRDSLGFARQPWHDFRARYTFASVTPSGRPRHDSHRFCWAGSLVSLEGYRTRPQLSRWFYDAELSRLSLELAVNQGQLDGTLYTETSLAGYHWQSLSAGSRPERPDGLAVTLSSAAAYRYESSIEQGFDNRQGVLHLPGAAVDLYAQRGWLSAELLVRAAPDFAGISSGAYPSWAAAHPDARPKTILRREGYFYGWGWSAWGALRLRGGPVWAESSLRYSKYDSQEGLDRAQDRVTEDIDLDEIVTEYSLALGVSPVTGVGIGASRKVNHRLSWAGAISARAWAEEHGLFIELSF